MKDQQCSQFSLSLFLAPQRLNFLAGSLAFSCFSVNGILMLLILDFSVLIIMENEDLALFPLSPPSPGVLSLTFSLYVRYTLRIPQFPQYNYISYCG